MSKCVHHMERLTGVFAVKYLSLNSYPLWCTYDTVHPLWPIPTTRHSLFCNSLFFLTFDRWFTHADLLLPRFYERLCDLSNETGSLRICKETYDVRAFRERKTIFYQRLRAASWCKYDSSVTGIRPFQDAISACFLHIRRSWQEWYTLKNILTTRQQ